MTRVGLVREGGGSGYVTATLVGDELHLVIGLPRGFDGGIGSKGIQGPPGEVTTQPLTDALNNAVAGTARNPTSIAPFAGTFSDPPTQSEMQAYVAWGETLRAALVR